MRTHLTTLTLCAVLALACSDAPPDDAAVESGQAPPAAAPDTATPAASGPAGEVAPETRTPAAPATASNVPPGVPAEFHAYFEKIPFTWGADAGLAKAAAEGKPAMLFYTADG